MLSLSSWVFLIERNTFTTSLATLVFHSTLLLSCCRAVLGIFFLYSSFFFPWSHDCSCWYLIFFSPRVDDFLPFHSSLWSLVQAQEFWEAKPPGSSMGSAQSIFKVLGDYTNRYHLTVGICHLEHLM